MKLYTNNREQLEAMQIAADLRNKETRAKLSEEARNKIELAENAVKDLTAAGIPCALFPLLQYRKDHGLECGNLHNLNDTLDLWGKNGMLKLEGGQAIKHFYEEVLISLFETPGLPWSNPDLDLTSRTQALYVCLGEAIMKRMK